MTAQQIGDRRAFPLNYPVGANFGMTYRQWLVGMAMQGDLCANSAGEWTAKECAERAIASADAILDELAKEE